MSPREFFFFSRFCEEKSENFGRFEPQKRKNEAFGRIENQLNQENAINL